MFYILLYSLYINLKNIILLKLKFVVVIVYEFLWDDICKKKMFLIKFLIELYNFRSVDSLYL